MLRPGNIKDEGRIVLNYGPAGCACDDLQILIRKRIREMQPLMRHGREVIMQYTLKNEILEMTADTHGAEILSVTVHMEWRPGILGEKDTDSVSFCGAGPRRRVPAQ